ncbi:F-box protein family [Quillaja saponaria]|uniref:F-box protein family n=1 Tax=Quillaja saponaria TaxID=32244 RepID=A0AAD7QFZ4_QUISA|nr:F-box protein family [Quillaja saponaria]
MGSSIDDLPEVLLVDILSRLPVEYLIRCKAVKKFWYDIINNPNFVTYYCNFFFNNKSGMLVSSYIDTALGKRDVFLSLLSFNESGDDISLTRLDLPLDWDNINFTLNIMGPCNGIYYLDIVPEALINPSLREFKALPDSDIAPFGTEYGHVLAGFGYDGKTNDYKVVKLMLLCERETPFTIWNCWRAEIYSLNANCWREVDDAVPPIDTDDGSPAYRFVNGCFHWMACDVISESEREVVVLSFDMVDEVFRKIRLPDIGDDCETIPYVAPYNDSTSIAVIVYPLQAEEGTEKSFNVWVMKDYWDDGSWVKQFTIGPITVVPVPLGFHRNNQLFFQDNNGKLVVYDPDDPQLQLKDLRVYGKQECLITATYMESIASLRRGNEFSPKQLVSFDG